MRHTYMRTFFVPYPSSCPTTNSISGSFLCSSGLFTLFCLLQKIRMWLLLTSKSFAYLLQRVGWYRPGSGYPVVLLALIYGAAPKWARRNQVGLCLAVMIVVESPKRAAGDFWIMCIWVLGNSVGSGSHMCSNVEWLWQLWLPAILMACSWGVEMLRISDTVWNLMKFLHTVEGITLTRHAGANVTPKSAKNTWG